MLFSNNERMLLIAALETYDDEPRKKFDAFTQHLIAANTLKKLNKLSSKTVFTASELEIMCLSVQMILASLSQISGMEPPEYYSRLLDRLIAMKRAVESN